MRVPKLSADGTYMSAEMYSFWTLYLAPVLLRRQFTSERYYNHFVRLVQLLNICLQFEITQDEIDKVQSGFNAWVRDYER